MFSDGKERETEGVAVLQVSTAPAFGPYQFSPFALHRFCALFKEATQLIHNEAPYKKAVAIVMNLSTAINLILRYSLSHQIIT